MASLPPRPSPAPKSNRSATGHHGAGENLAGINLISARPSPNFLHAGNRGRLWPSRNQSDLLPALPKFLSRWKSWQAVVRSITATVCSDIYTRLARQIGNSDQTRWLQLSAPVLATLADHWLSQDGAEGSVVDGSGNGNSIDPSASQHATPTSQVATPISQAATPTSEAATPTSQVTSGRAGSKRKLTSAVWNEMESKLENGEWKAECNYCHKKFASGPSGA